MLKLIKISSVLFAVSCIFFVIPAIAASPVGADTFQLFASPTTGGDNTGDGGTGAASDLNYYYVGQTFTTTMEIVSGGTTAANIWIDYNSALMTASNLLDGTFFNIWSGQTIDPTATGGEGGRIYQTGAEIPVVSQSGTGTFGTVSWTSSKPTAAAYGTGAAGTLDINVGTIGLTTESNISLSGVDLLNDEEDFNFHIWADTVAPFAENPSPLNTAVGVAVDVNYTFDLRDTLNGDGDNTGVGTGVNTSTTPGVITFDDGTGAVDYTSYDSYSCSGTWGTNFCGVTINPPSPLSISGDTRNWKYGTTYTVSLSGFQDLASASQGQLGDANGPNVMATKVYTFTTASDLVAPQVVNETPSRGGSGASISNNLTILVEDRISYPSGVSGVGVDISTCKVDLSSATFALTTYELGDTGYTPSVTDYGYSIDLDPATDFGENETVTVKVYDCTDTVGNIMSIDNYSFVTVDESAPFVDSLVPANDATLSESGTITFSINDVGLGIDLSQVVVYVNGQYYSDGGGSGSVTTTGTSITFADSLDFNGSNYAGDTTSVSGTTAKYDFIIDPETDFGAGEAIPILIYAQDSGGTLMERSVYGVSTSGAASGGSCPSGETFCGLDTSWNGSKCNAFGGQPAVNRNHKIEINQSTIIVSQIDEHSVLVSWTTNRRGSARVLYDTKHAVSFTTPPNYGIQWSTDYFDDDSYQHSVVVDGLTPGVLYYFRPVSSERAVEVIGNEVKMTPRFVTEVLERFVDSDSNVICEVPAPVPVSCVPGEVVEAPIAKTQILNFEIIGDVVRLKGVGNANSRLNFAIY